MRTYTLLIVDDCLDDVEEYSTLLRNVSASYNYSTFSVASVKEAEALLTDTMFDCMLLSYNLLKDSPTVPFEMLFGNQSLSMVPVIVLSLEHSQQEQATAARMGAFNYQAKDACNSPEALDQLIQQAIYWSRLRSSQREASYV